MDRSSPNEIPRIIHQTWKNKEIPEEWKDCVQSWKAFNPEYTIKLWTDADNRQFIMEYYPEFLSVFDAYSYGIQRADAIRYFLLYHFGGLYVDLDFECLQPIEPLLHNKKFVIGLEPGKHATNYNETSLICNAFMASVPKHQFLKEVLTTLKTISPKISLHNEVLSTTGPLMINNVLKRTAIKDVTVLKEHVVYPFHSGQKELSLLFNKKNKYREIKNRCIKNGTFAIHYWGNSWVRSLAGELENPRPFDVEGYRFYPGRDSAGFDIENFGRNIDTLASECNKNKQALGFNTDGFIKYQILPFYRWSRIDDKNGNQGLYVKKGLRHFCVRWLRLLVLFTDKLNRVNPFNRRKEST